MGFVFIFDEVLFKNYDVPSKKRLATCHLPLDQHPHTGEIPVAVKVDLFPMLFRKHQCWYRTRTCPVNIKALTKDPVVAFNDSKYMDNICSRLPMHRNLASWV